MKTQKDFERVSKMYRDELPKVKRLDTACIQKDFYGKAITLTYGDGTVMLQSYSTKVAVKFPDGEVFRLWDGWSQTTGRHIKAFCGMNKAEFNALPLVTI